MHVSKLLLSLFAAGGLGSLARYGLSSYLTSFFGKGTPWGVAIVNILGCLCFGALAAIFALKTDWDPQIKTIALTGFFGAFTTFSTYAFELNELIKSGAYLRAGTDFLLQNVGGLVAVAIGATLVKRLVGA